MSSPPTAERATWIEAGRLYALFIILLFHMPFTQGMHETIGALNQTSWVIFFFLLSGFFYGKKTIGQPHLPWLDSGRFLILLIPFIVWEGIYLFACDTHYFFHEWWALSIQEKGSWFLHSFLGIGGRPINEPLWFLRDLAFFSLIAPMLARLPRGILLSIAGIFILLPWKDWFSIEDVRVNPSFDGGSYFLLGMALSNINLEKGKLFFQKWGGFFLLMSLYLSGVTWWGWSDLDLPSRFHNIIGLMGIFTIGALMVTVIKDTVRIIPTLSRGVFFLYSSHIVLLCTLHLIVCWVVSGLHWCFPSFPEKATELSNSLWCCFVPAIIAASYALRTLLEKRAPRTLHWLEPTKSAKKQTSATRSVTK